MDEIQHPSIEGFFDYLIHQPILVILALAVLSVAIICSFNDGEE
jgi:hypothetical protein